MSDGVQIAATSIVMLSMLIALAKIKKEDLYKWYMVVALLLAMMVW